MSMWTSKIEYWRVTDCVMRAAVPLWRLENRELRIETRTSGTLLYRALLTLTLVALASCQEREIRIHYEEAEAHRAAGRTEQAIGAYRQALALDSTDVNTLNNIGFLHARMGRPDSALKHYRTAALQDSTVAEVHYNAGVSFVTVGAFGDAQAAYERAVRHDHRHVEAFNNLGALFERRGRAEAAHDRYERATAIDSTFVPAWINVGRTRFMMGRFDDAAAAYRKALELKPDLTDAHTDLASVYAEAGDLDRAIHHLERATGLAPDSRRAKDNLAQVLEMRDDRDRRREAGEMRARQIVVNNEGLAHSLLLKIRSGEDFATIARVHSIDPSGGSGGDIGAFKPGDLLPAFEEAVKGLQPGGVGGPLRTAVGWHIIKRIY